MSGTHAHFVHEKARALLAGSFAMATVKTTTPAVRLSLRRALAGKLQEHGTVSARAQLEGQFRG